MEKNKDIEFANRKFMVCYGEEAQHRHLDDIDLQETTLPEWVLENGRFSEAYAYSDIFAFIKKLEDEIDFVEDDDEHPGENNEERTGRLESLDDMKKWLDSAESAKKDGATHVLYHDSFSREDFDAEFYFPDAEEVYTDFESQRQNHRYMLFEANINNELIDMAVEGDLAGLEELIEQGADINAKNEDGETALMASAEGGHLDCVKYLAEVGADINLKNNYGATTLILAAQNGHLDCVKYLHGQGADINAKSNSGSTALMGSASGGHLDCIKYLHGQGVDINAKNNNRYTALMGSAYNGHLACLKYLIEQGADIHAKDEDGYTALMWSAFNGHLACAQHLTQAWGRYQCSR